MAGEPFCGNCGYTLIGLTESSKCPECGRALVEVLQRRGSLIPRGKRYKSKTELFGLPLVHVAIGPDGDDRFGKACGIIAIGTIARGWIALGAVSVGIVSVGAVSAGVVSIGATAFGLLAVIGALVVGGMAYGNVGAGIIAKGNVIVGYAADGNVAVGQYARGRVAIGPHCVGLGGPTDAEAARFFSDWGWLMGRGITLDSHIAFAAWTGGVIAAVGLVVAAVIAINYYLSHKAAGAK